MKYTYIDGDNIGLIIEQCFLGNDETGLRQINQKVINAIENISSYLTEKKQELIFAGADGIIVKGKEIDLNQLIAVVRQVDTDLTFSIGVGESLKDSYIALRYAKSYGKNIAVTLVNKTKFLIVK